MGCPTHRKRNDGDSVSIPSAQYCDLVPPICADVLAHWPSITSQNLDFKAAPPTEAEVSAKILSILSTFDKVSAANVSRGLPSICCIPLPHHCIAACLVRRARVLAAWHAHGLIASTDTKINHLDTGFLLSLSSSTLR